MKEKKLCWYLKTLFKIKKLLNYVYNELQINCYCY